MHLVRKRDAPGDAALQRRLLRKRWVRQHAANKAAASVWEPRKCALDGAEHVGALLEREIAHPLRRGVVLHARKHLQRAGQALDGEAPLLHTKKDVATLPLGCLRKTCA